MDGKYFSAGTFWIVVLFCLVLLIPTSSQAVPARPVIESLTQPDGTVIGVRQFGDEWSNGVRTQDGYTLLLDETTGFWVYAEPDINGNAQKSPWIAGHHEPLGIPKRLPMPAPLSALPREELESGLAPEALEPAPNLGTQPLLVIFVDFTPSVRVASTASTLNSKFFGATSSVKDYYEEVSYGNFSVGPATESDSSLSGNVNDGIVSVVLSYPHPSPGSAIDDRNRNITRDALIAANSFVDFSLFDTNGDGVISPTELHIVIIVAGYERSFSSSPCGSSVWGHQWGLFGTVPVPILDGKAVGATYTQFGEWHCSSFSPPGHAATIGIMVHELGHDLGLPDLYDIDLSSEGIGEWGVMGGGSWTGVSLPGDSPAHMDPWSKYFEGWISPTLVSGTLTNEPISQAATAADVYQFLTGTPSTGEYFLVENRQKTGYDAGLPGTGLLIWHIDASKNLNTDECYPGGPSCAVSHYKVAVVQADNLYNLEKGNNNGDTGDPWPGSTGNRNFTDVSTPDSDLYNGTPSGVSVTNISNSGSTMTATLSLLSPRTLTVASSNPNSGVSITVSPNDNNGQGNGPTQFTRTYNNNVPVNLTAPATAGGNNFQKWQRGGSDWSTSPSTQVTMDANHTMTAMYVTPCSTTSIAFGSTVTGTLSNSDCDAPDRAGRFADLYTFSGTAGQQIKITMNSTAFDTFLFLKNPAGTVIASNDDCSGAGLNSCIPSDALAGGSLSLPSTGSYTIEATSFSPSATGTYSVTLTLVSPPTFILTVASSNPSSGVSITVTPNDNNGQGNGSTQFNRTYNNNTVVNLTAPATAGGNNFQKWQRDGVDWAFTQNTNVTMDANHTMTAVYATPTRSLTVGSSNPNSGVSITVSPNDNNGQGNGTTQFTRTYNNNVPVNLTAPATAGGNNFQKWQRDGVDWSTNLTTQVTMDANHTMTAVYAAPPRTLTVGSSNPNSGVSITVSPNDNNGQGNGTTQFTRTYNNNVPVNLTAPATAGGNNFQKWQRDGVDWAFTQATSLTMDANHTMTAVYTGCSVTSINIGDVVTGSLDNNDCDAPNRPGTKADRYTFSGTSGQQVTIAMSSLAFDTYLILIGPTGVVVTFDDDSGRGANSLISNIILPDSGTYTIEATAFSAAGRGAYTLSLNTGPLIRVLAANGGENWQIGSTQNIQWASNFNGNVKILLSRNGGTRWNVLSKSTANDGNRLWKVKGATQNALIKVCRVKAPSLCDISDSSFTIQP